MIQVIKRILAAQRSRSNRGGLLDKNEETDATNPDCLGIVPLFVQIAFRAVPAEIGRVAAAVRMLPDSVESDDREFSLQVGKLLPESQQMLSLRRLHVRKEEMISQPHRGRIVEINQAEVDLHPAIALHRIVLGCENDMVVAAHFHHLNRRTGKVQRDRVDLANVHVPLLAVGILHQEQWKNIPRLDIFVNSLGVNLRIILVTKSKERKEKRWIPARAGMTERANGNSPLPII